MYHTVDKSGMRFGKLLVLSRAEKHDVSRHYYWNCICDCGKEIKVVGNNLSEKKYSSCGCKKQQRCLTGLNKKPAGKSSLHAIFTRYKWRANMKRLVFNLTEDEFNQLTKMNCKYCGISPAIEYQPKGANGSVHYNGIDRVDNSIGYTIENCVPCCKLCNLAKRDLPLDVFLKHIERLVNFNKEVSNSI